MVRSDGISLEINGDTIPSDIYIRKAGEINDQQISSIVHSALHSCKECKW